MRVVIVGGAGEMGSVAVEYLNRQPQCREIVVADYNYEAAANLQDRLGGHKISIRECDVTDHFSLKKAVAGATVVMNFAGPFYRLAHYVIEAVLDSKTGYYVDICDDYDATCNILEYNDDAKKVGTTILTGMGASPGITNVYARMGADRLDQAEKIDTAWLTGASGEGRAVLLHLLHSAAGEIPTYRDGAYHKVKAMDDAGALRITFPEPLGEVTFYDIGHPEPITIPRFISGIKTVTNKGAFGPSTKTIRDIVQAELWREEPVKVGAHLISPAEFTVAFLQQNPHLISPGDSIELGALYVSVTGKKAGEMVKYEFMSVSSASMGEGTGLPAAAAAILLGSGKIKQPGVIAPECIDPSLLLTPLAKNPVPEGQVNSGLIIRLTRENGEINVLSPGRPLTIPSIN